MSKKFKTKKILSTVAASALILGTVVTPAMASPGDYYQASTKTQFTAAQLQADTNGSIKNVLRSASAANGTDILVQFQNSLLQYAPANTLINQYITSGQSLAQISTELQAPNTASSSVDVSAYTPYGALTVASVSATSGTVTVGGTTGFTFKNSDGTAATPTGVTYSVTSSNASTGFFNNGVFTATAPGAYTIQAAFGSTKLTTTVNVSGTVSAIKISAGSSLVANNTSTETVTVTAVDANGSLVPNFNGKATLHFDSTNGAFKFVPSTDTKPAFTDGSVLTTDQTITITNGTATFTVIGGNIPGITDKIEMQGLKDSNGIAVTGYQASSISIGTVAQVATAITVKPEVNYVEVNDGAGTVNFDVNVNDQTGNPMLGGTYNLTGALTGGGTFTDGTISGAVIVVTSGNKAVITADAPVGITGTYQLTVTGSNLTSGSGNVTSSVAQKTAQLAMAVPSSSASSFVDGTGTTAVTFSTVDVNSVPTGTSLVSGHTYALYLNDSQNNAFTNATVTINGGTSNNTSASLVSNGYTIPADATGVTVSDGSGKANAGSYTVVLKDTTTASGVTALTASAPLTLTIKPGTTVGKIGVTVANNVLTGSGSTLNTNVSIKLEDSNGNAINGNSDSLSISASAVGTNQGKAEFDGNTLSSTPSETLTTGSTGTASANFVAQTYGGDKWNVVVNDTTASVNTNSSPVEVDLITNPAASYSFMLKDSSSGSMAYLNAGDTVQLVSSSGSAITLANSALDANSNAITTAGNDNVTLTISHAAGLIGLPSSSGVVGTNVNATVSSSTDTTTLTGSLTNVSNYIKGLSLKGGTSGVVTLSLKDNSTGATGSANISVSAGTAVSTVTIPELSAATVTSLPKNTANAITIDLVDAGGNQVIATQDTAVTVSSTTGSGITFQDSNRLPQTSLTVKKGSSSVSGYVVTSTTGSALTLTIQDTTDSSSTSFTKTLAVQ